MSASDPTDGRHLEPGEFEELEFVTLSGHHYVHVHLTEDGWKQERGFLERRHHESPVSVDCRRQKEVGGDQASVLSDSRRMGERRRRR